MVSTLYDPIRLEVFKHLLSSIAEEMGVVLRKASYSPNIKERRDFSCAVFNARGNMVAQAAHIPVHLGSMPLSVAQAIAKIGSDLAPGDIVILNDPFLGGTHLPDITLISPVFVGNSLFGFVANRAHHADVGGMAAGSMSVAQEIFQEGLIIPPVKLASAGEINQPLLELILANVRTPDERFGDLWAQIAANQRGAARFSELAAVYGTEEVAFYMEQLLTYTERLTRNLLASLPDGTFRFSDFLDGDGVIDDPIPIQVAITIHGDEASVDFSGSAPQQKGSVNAVFAITFSAVFYVFRCLLSIEAPNNSGSMAPVHIIAPPGSIVNANSPAAVVAGNVETSQRIVDVLLGALAQACPDRIPAASQGTMNNITIGGQDPRSGAAFTYYETIAGGMGARPSTDGPSAIHSHMTNTLNTPVEALEYAYPLRVLRYEIRRGSGGKGRYRGGDGVRRDILLLAAAQASLLTERRKFKPYGLAGGEAGQPGENALIRDDIEKLLPAKCTLELKAGDILSIRTPGGGGHGNSG